MKWESAKTWLIIAFLFLDLVLGWQVYAQHQAQVAYVESYSDLLANTKTLLSEHGLILDAQVPQSHTQMSVLKGTFSQPSLTDLANVAFTGNGPVSIDQSSATAKSAEGTIQITDHGIWTVNYNKPMSVSAQSPADILKYVWQGKDYQVDSVDTPGGPDKSNATGYNFYETYESYPVFDATITALVGKPGLSSFRQVSVSQFSAVGDSKPTISALDALGSLANSIDQMLFNSGSRILNIEMGYAQKVAGDSAPDTSASALYWFPVWRIVTTQSTYFVNAYTGEVNGPSKS